MSLENHYYNLFRRCMAGIQGEQKAPNYFRFWGDIYPREQQFMDTVWPLVQALSMTPKVHNRQEFDATIIAYIMGAIGTHLQQTQPEFHVDNQTSNDIYIYNQAVSMFNRQPQYPQQHYTQPQYQQPNYGGYPQPHPQHMGGMNRPPQIHGFTQQGYQQPPQQFNQSNVRVDSAFSSNQKVNTNMNMNQHLVGVAESPMPPREAPAPVKEERKDVRRNTDILVRNLTSEVYTDHGYVVGLNPKFIGDVLLTRVHRELHLTMKATGDGVPEGLVEKLTSANGLDSLISVVNSLDRAHGMKDLVVKFNHLMVKHLEEILRIIYGNTTLKIQDYANSKESLDEWMSKSNIIDDVYRKTFNAVKPFFTELVSDEMVGKGEVKGYTITSKYEREVLVLPWAVYPDVNTGDYKVTDISKSGLNSVLDQVFEMLDDDVYAIEAIDAGNVRLRFIRYGNNGGKPPQYHCIRIDQW